MPKPGLFIPLLFALILSAGCEDSYFDEVGVHSAHEYLTRESRAEELIYAVRNAGLVGVALVAGAREAPVLPPFPDPPEADDPNELVLKAGETLPGLLIPFVHIPTGEGDPLELFRKMHERGARGLALWRTGSAEETALDDAVLSPLYRYLEINGVPVFCSINPEYLEELSTLLRDHPALKVVAGGLLGLPGDLPRVQRFLERHPKLFVDTGFDAEPGFEAVFQEILAGGEARAFFKEMKDRVLFAGGLLFDHRIYRRGLWGMQVFKAYRSFLEKEEIDLLLRDGEGVWKPVAMPALALPGEQLEKIYHDNFRKVVGMSFHDPVPSDMDSLIINAPEGWRYDPVSPRRMIAALVAPHQKLVSMISTQRLRDIFAGKLRDWREINGEPGPIRLASYGPLVRIVADRLDAPLQAKVLVFDDIGAMREAIESRGDLLGILPFADLDGRLAVISVDGDNPCVSNLRFCAAKAAPTVSAYFSTYPLLIPASFPEDARTRSFDPFEIRTILIAGRIRVPGPIPSLSPEGAALGDKDKALKEAALRVKPVYEILPQVRRADLAAFFDEVSNPDQAYLLRILGARVILGRNSFLPFGAKRGEPVRRIVNSIRGVPVNFVPEVGQVACEGCQSGEGITILALPEGASESEVLAGLDRGAAAVFRGRNLAALPGFSPMNLDLGDFLGEEGAPGFSLTLSFYGDRLQRFTILPLVTRKGAVQRRFGEGARSDLLSAFPPGDSPDAHAEPGDDKG